MTPESATLLADYNRWMNGKVYDAAASLPFEDVIRERGAFFGSIFATLTHICVGDTVWLHRFAQHPAHAWLAGRLAPFPQPTDLRAQLAADLPALRAHRDALDALIIDWTARLGADDMHHALPYQNMAGVRQARPFGALLTHFFNHQTHHRGQVTTLLSQAGVNVGVTDLLARIPRSDG